MKAWMRSLRQTLEQQIETWEHLVEGKQRRKMSDLRVITVSREAGSGGKLVATRLAQVLGLTLYDRNIIQKIADRAHTDSHEVASRDERGGSVVEEWMNSLLRHRYLWPEKYLQHLSLWPSDYLAHLKRVIDEIAAQEGGVIVGRGANFILAPENCLRVRLVAPLPVRVAYMAALFEVPPKIARKRVESRDAERRAFVKHYFKQEIGDPQHYDLVLNMDLSTIDQAANTIRYLLDRTRGEGSDRV
ncbi:MAG: cytidylate kinase-like family protein [Bradymonadales bacterium]|nr:cytidylate kinase-like family protein [Bradymonadales bacterium]